VEGADAVQLLPGDKSLSGRLNAEINVTGSGRSPVALIGSLEGAGTFHLEDGRMVRVDPTVFDTVMRAVDMGLPMDNNRVRDRVDQALGTAGLPIPQAAGVIAISAGQARLGNTAVRAQGLDLSLSGNLSLVDGALDGRMMLIGAAGPTAPGGTRPEIAISIRG